MVDRTTERAQSSKAKKIPGAFPNPDLKCYVYNQKKKNSCISKKTRSRRIAFLDCLFFFPPQSYHVCSDSQTHFRSCSRLSLSLILNLHCCFTILSPPSFKRMIFLVYLIYPWGPGPGPELNERCLHLWVRLLYARPRGPFPFLFIFNPAQGRFLRESKNVSRVFDLLSSSCP